MNSGISNLTAMKKPGLQEIAKKSLLFLVFRGINEFPVFYFDCSENKLVFRVAENQKNHCCFRFLVGSMNFRFSILTAVKITWYFGLQKIQKNSLLFPVFRGIN